MECPVQYAEVKKKPKKGNKRTHQLMGNWKGERKLKSLKVKCRVTSNGSVIDTVALFFNYAFAQKERERESE